MNVIRKDMYRVVQGCDVSYCQGEMNWDEVDSSIEFVIVRAGAIGAGENGRCRISTDITAVENVKGALKSGRKVGIYYFMNNIPKNGLIKIVNDIKFYVEIFGRESVEMGVWFDPEYGALARYGNNTEVFRKDLAAVLDYIKRAGLGVKVGLYYNLDFYKNVYTPSFLDKVLPPSSRWCACWRGRKILGRIYQKCDTMNIQDVKVDQDYIYMTPPMYNKFKYGHSWGEDG